MKRILTAALIVLSIGLFSCQKEVDDILSGSGNNGGGTTGTLLTKITSKSGTDSATLTFNYNSNKKLIGFNSEIISGGLSVIVSETAVRNAQGIIQQVIYKSDEYQQLGLDSVISVIKYSGGKYTSEVTEFNVGGIIIVDSIALFYDAAGKVTKEEQYFSFMGAAELAGKTEYTYNGNNLATMNNYSWDGSAFNLEETYTYDQYDDKVNPMYFGNEAFVFGSPVFYSANNPLKSSQSVLSVTENYTTTYAYNSSKRPTSAVSVSQPSGDVSTGNYYYQ